jgi:hypothetical protein
LGIQFWVIKTHTWLILPPGFDLHKPGCPSFPHKHLKDLVLLCGPWPQKDESSIATSNQRINLMNIFHKVHTSHDVSLKNKLKLLCFCFHIQEIHYNTFKGFMNQVIGGQDCSIICLTTQFSLYNNYTTLFRQLSIT